MALVGATGKRQTRLPLSLLLPLFPQKTVESIWDWTKAICMALTDMYNKLVNRIEELIQYGDTLPPSDGGRKIFWETDVGKLYMDIQVGDTTEWILMLAGQNAEILDSAADWMWSASTTGEFLVFDGADWVSQASVLADVFTSNQAFYPEPDNVIELGKENHVWEKLWVNNVDARGSLGGNTLQISNPPYTQRTGFINGSDITLTWNNNSAIVSISSTGEFQYYVSGDPQYGSLMEAELTTAASTGLWMIYISGENWDVLTADFNPNHSEIDTIIETNPIAAWVYWNVDLAEGKLMRELHDANMPREMHHWLHDNVGASYRDGMALDNLLVDSNGGIDAHAQFSIGSGSFYDEDIEHELSAVSSTAAIDVWYRDGSDWTWDQLTGFKILTHGSGRLAYDNAGVKTEVTNGNYVLYHVFATNIVDDGGTNPHYISIMGQTQYNTLAAARAGADDEINNLALGGLPLPEFLAVATIIFQTQTSYANSVNARVRSTGDGHDYIDWRFSKIKGGAAVADHGTMAGLGDDDHLQYLLAADAIDRTTFATNWLDLTDGGETTLHSHAAAPAAALDELSDVTISGEVTGEVLTFDGAEWVNSATQLVDHALGDHTDVSVGTVTGEALVYDGATWVNDNVDAQYVTFAATGGIIAIDVQAAIEELDDEKSDSGHDHDLDYAALVHDHDSDYVQLTDATYVTTGLANWTDLTDAGATTLHSHATPATVVCTTVSATTVKAGKIGINYPNPVYLLDGVASAGADAYIMRFGVEGITNGFTMAYKHIGTRPLYNFSDIPVYANNAAAVVGGLAAGHLYRTGGDPDLLCIVH